MGPSADSVNRFYDCLEQHSRDRGLSPNSTSYWIAATALNQWTVGGDWLSDAFPEVGSEDMLTRSPLRAKFRLAMEKCTGTLCVVDEAAASFSRLWVCYETHIALGMRAHKFDIYTPARAQYENGHGHLVASAAVGLLDGLGVVRSAGVVSLPVLEASGRSVSRGGAGLLSRGSGGGASVVAAAVVAPPSAASSASTSVAPESVFEKDVREGFFPWSLADALLKVDLECGSTSIRSDRWKILNCISNPRGDPPNINAEPRLAHPSYTHANRKLAGRVAAACLRRALNEAEAADRLAAQHGKKLSLALRDEGELVRKRLQRLLHTISNSRLDIMSLDLHGRDGFAMTRSRVNKVLNALPSELETLHLQLDQDKCPSSLCLGRACLTVLDLSGSSGLASSVDGSGFRDADYLFPKLTRLHTLKFCRCMDLDLLPEKLGGLPSLTTLDVSNCPLITSLPRKLPATLQNIILTGTPIVSLGQGVSSLRRLQTLVGLGQELVELSDLSGFVGNQLDLQHCVQLYSTQVDAKTDLELTAVYKKHPFDALAWLRLVFPWVVALEKTRGVIVHPPRFSSSIGEKEIRRVDETFQHLVDEVRQDMLQRSKKMALKLNQRALLSPRVNKMRATSVCRSETRKRSSLEELRLEAERMVRLSAKTDGPAWEKSPPREFAASGKEDENGGVIHRIRSQLDALDVELYQKYVPIKVEAPPLSGRRASKEVLVAEPSRRLIAPSIDVKRRVSVVRALDTDNSRPAQSKRSSRQGRIRRSVER